MSGSAVAHLLDQFLATFICKVTEGLLGKGHYILVLTCLCAEPLFQHRDLYIYISFAPASIVCTDIRASFSVYMESNQKEHYQLCMSHSFVSTLSNLRNFRSESVN